MVGSPPAGKGTIGSDGNSPLDILVVGSGVAGLTAALKAATKSGLRVGVLTKGELAQSTTRWAQGGVAAVMGDTEFSGSEVVAMGDSTDLHFSDTLSAGAGLCDREAVRVMVEEGPRQIADLVAIGALFDRVEGGGLSLVREGGHSTARVIHAGGAATGAEIERALVKAVQESAAALYERTFATDLVVEAGRCVGVRAIDPQGRACEVRAANVVIATGGAGQMFDVTTNPSEATGDGLAMAIRAGVPVADVEFMQFHPTALHHPAMPRPLLSEALRGHGALLRDAHGERFVDELSSRDVVSRAMQARMIEQGATHLWLDATELADFAVRFPTIAASLEQVDLDPTSEWLPVAPAAHHISGGVVTDLSGATFLEGLWACGEVACSGVHGANRLASNSLLEGLVFGSRVIDAISGGVVGPRPSGAMRALIEADEDPDNYVPARLVPGAVGVRGGNGDTGDIVKLRRELQCSMTLGAGVLRNATSLEETRQSIESLRQQAPAGTDPGSWELANLIASADALVRAAIIRCETRGAHNRTDFPDFDPLGTYRVVQ